MLQTKKSSAPWLMLISRSVLFFAFQVVIALILSATGTQLAGNTSARWWPFTALFTNVVSIYLLIRVFRAEGQRYLDILRFSRATFKTDLLWLLGLSIIGLVLATAPMNILASMLFEDAMIPTHMLFNPLPTWALVVSLLFPLTIAFAELPTYFGYVMPRLETQLKNGWIAWGIASFFLAAQHMFLPLILDGRFILWRLGTYLPFAFFIGLALKWRPRLLPYFVIVHALMDISALAVYLTI